MTAATRSTRKPKAAATTAEPQTTAPEPEVAEAAETASETDATAQEEAVDAAPLTPPVEDAGTAAAPLVPPAEDATADVAASTAPLEPPVALNVTVAVDPTVQLGELGVASLGKDARETVRIIDEATGETITDTEGLFVATGPAGGAVRSTKYLLREVTTGSFGRTTTTLLVTPHTTLRAEDAQKIVDTIQAYTAA